MSIKSKELKPNKDNLVECISGDYIDRNNALRQFVTLCNMVEESCSIAIDGKWGDGKTFFVKQTKLIIDSYNKFIDSDLSEEERNTVLSAIDHDNKLGIRDYIPQVCVYYDAWANDNDEDPLLSIIYEISKTASINYDSITDTDFLDIAATIFDSITGKGYKNLYEVLKGEGPLAAIKKEKAVDTIIAEFLNALLPERGERLIVIIDELDCCKPSFAVKLHERIKHCFDNEKITFVFAINTEELQHVVKKHYGDDFDAGRYLDRFFDFRLTLPPANMEKYYHTIGISKNSYTFDVICKLVAAQYGFSLRETEKYFRNCNTAAYRITHIDGGWAFDDHRGYSFGYAVIVPLIIGLKMADLNLYNAFVEGHSSKPLIDLLMNDARSRRMCFYLLDDSETFVETSEMKTHIDLHERLEQTYRAHFNNKDPYNPITVGRCEFSNRTTQSILEVASMLSEHATY